MKKALRKLVFLILFTGLISYTYCFCEDSNNIKEYDEVPIAWINHTSDTGIRLLLNTKYEDENIPPFVVQKKDGATLYSTRDFAALKYRIERWDPEKIYYPMKLHI